MLFMWYMPHIYMYLTNSRFDGRLARTVTVWEQEDKLQQPKLIQYVYCDN